MKKERRKRKKMTKLFKTIPGTILDYDKDQIAVVEIPCRKGKPYSEVMFMGDLHIGHKEFARSQLLKYLLFLKSNPDVFVVGMGDYFEAVEFTHFYPDAESAMKHQIQEFLQMFSPVKDQLLAMVYGNHDERFATSSQGAVDLLEYLCLKLGNTDIKIAPPQKGMLLVIKVINGQGKVGQVYPVYVHHSSTSATVNLEAQFKRTEDNFQVPLIVHGHTHKVFWKERTFFSVAGENGNYHRAIMRRFWLSSGSFLRFAGYAERSSMQVPDIKAPIVRFYADRNLLQYIDPVTEYADYLEPSEPSKTDIDAMFGKLTTSTEDIDFKPARPFCPKCKSNRIISKGPEWQCSDCHRRWMKEKKNVSNK